MLLLNFAGQCTRLFFSALDSVFIAVCLYMLRELKNPDKTLIF